MEEAHAETNEVQAEKLDSQPVREQELLQAESLPLPAVGVLKKKGLAVSAPASLRQNEVKKVPEQAVTEPSLRGVFTQDQLQVAWNGFADVMEKNERLNLSSTLRASVVALQGEFKVQVTVLNRVQEEQVNEVRVDLLQFIRKQLAHDFLEMSIAVPKTDEVGISAQFLTERERYDAIVKKNPHLDTLRKRLDLDLG
jgi:DNA polymerase III subunit gamma/tau